jgi:hypothetical protein
VTAAPVPAAVLGRGLIATEARSLIRRMPGRLIELTPDHEAAKAIILATTEDAAATFIDSCPEDCDGRLVYDLSGYAKQSGRYNYALPAALFGDQDAVTEGVIAVPACYASSVLIPALYLIKNRYVSRVLGIHAVCVGGRTTLGASGEIAEGNLRFASAQSTARHQREVLANLPPGFSFCDMAIMVGDLESGILCSSYLSVTGKSVPELSVRLDPVRQTWLGEPPGEGQAAASLAGLRETPFRFSARPAAAAGVINVTSYVHNLDLPLTIIFAHLRAVMAQGGGQAGQRPTVGHGRPGLERTK